MKYVIISCNYAPDKKNSEGGIGLCDPSQVVIFKDNLHN